jgi:hypothetical protein
MQSPIFVIVRRFVFFSLVHKIVVHKLVYFDYFV